MGRRVRGMGWTTEQEQVIAARNCNLLVSAAAGSGKTAVLVERIITRLIEGEDPLNVDQLLVVTFTEAAAAEMKERIRGAIEKKLEEEPENIHLQRQATLIHHARITTIHSFCLSVVRDYFHTIDLEPGFRTMEEGERKLLMQEVMEELLEEEYRKGEASFTDFVEMAATGRDDRKVEELILNLYEFSRSNPDPETWLCDSIQSYEEAENQPWDSLPFVKLALEQTWASLEDLEQSLVYAKSVCEDTDGPAAYEAAIVSDIERIRKLRKAESFQKLQEALSGLSFDRLATNRDQSVSEEKIQTVKSLRDQVKKELTSIRDQFFYEIVEELRGDLRRAKPFVQELVRLTVAFGQAFEAKKQSQGVIDFGDMEQYALRILRKEEIAEEYRNKYEEIMIDEYQDSNLIQETLLTQISRVNRGKYNVFMVGDVKQSIYRFRLSRPELFMEKYETYGIEADGPKRRIDLHKNFRSRREVLDAVNYLFYQIMTKALGRVEYDEQAALYVGARFEEKPGFDTEVLLIEEGDSLESKELEARAVAARIKELKAGMVIFDKESGTCRSVAYRDIVILLRSLKGWTDIFSNVLNEEGIPTFCGTKEGYFQTREISLLLDYLKILDNEKQDLPLTAVLASCFGGLTSEELARIRCAYPQGPFYQAAMDYARERKDPKLCAFFAQVHAFRKQVPYTAIHELLETIVSVTGYRDYVLALPGGVQRRANLDMLIEKAKAYESTSYKGLFHFLRYVEQLRKYQVDYGEANTSDEMGDAVRLMSIHKSKGLEFPVVIVAGMGKRFNTQDIHSQMVIHQDLGIGVDAVYLKERMQAPTFLKKSRMRQDWKISERSFGYSMLRLQEQRKS
jgi:ATP-dependent helicase/nuclease subunit A